MRSITFEYRKGMVTWDIDGSEYRAYFENGKRIGSWLRLRGKKTVDVRVLDAQTRKMLEGWA